MLKFKYQIILIVVMLLLGCGKEDNDSSIPESTVDSQLPSIFPELVVSGLNESIETYTVLSVKVNHGQNVETNILLDGEILFTTALKEFKYDLNPYTIPVGPHTIVISTKDDEGHETSFDFNLNVKHLLMTYELGEKENNQSPFKWLFFNDIEGNLLAEFRAIPGVNKIYTDELIIHENIFYSIVIYNTSPDVDSKELDVITNYVPLGRNRSPIVKTDLPVLINQFVVNVNLIEPKNEYSLFWGQGSQYRVFTTGGGGYLETVGFIFDTTDKIYVRYDGVSGVRFLNGGTDLYKYLQFAPNPGYSEIVVEEQDFMLPETMVNIDLPEHEPGSMWIRRYGFANEQDIDTNTSHLIYEAQEDFGFAAQNLSLPILAGLGEYQGILSYRKNNKYYTVNGFENSFNVNMPNWIIDANIQNNSMTITAENEDVDLYSIRFRKSTVNNGSNYRRFDWLYRTFSNEVSGVIFPRLELPTTITADINEEYFRTTSDLNISGIYAIDYEKFNSYEEFMEYATFIQTNLTIKELGYREISFPTFNATGKTTTKTLGSCNEIIIE